MRWKVRLNQDHIKLWTHWAKIWLVYVSVIFVLGIRLHPRLDEVVFVTFLPLLVLVPYIALTFVMAATRLLLARVDGTNVRWSAFLVHRRLRAKNGIQKRPDR